MHHLLDRVVIPLGHHVFLAADALADADEELQQGLVTDEGAKNIIQRLDNLRQVFLFTRLAILYLFRPFLNQGIEI